jgi:hypothetical protein
METEETIDYKALYEGLQAELEQARLTILKMRQMRNPLDMIDSNRIRAFVQRNYLLIVLALMLASFIISAYKALWRDSHESTE